MKPNWRVNRRGFRERHAGGDQRPGPLGTLLGQPGVRRAAVDGGEAAQELEAADAGRGGQLAQRGRVGQLVVQPLPGLAHGDGRIGWRRLRGVARDQQPAGLHQRFLAGERIVFAALPVPQGGEQAAHGLLQRAVG